MDTSTIEIILGTAIPLIAFAIPVITKYYNRASIYLSIIKSLMEIVNDIIKRRSDGVLDSNDCEAIGRETVALVNMIHISDFVPAILKSK